jgi:hypothetical protein
MPFKDRKSPHRGRARTNPGDPQLDIEIDKIRPIRRISKPIKNSKPYLTMVAQILEGRMPAPLVVSAFPDKPGTYLLLDGHRRLCALSEARVATVKCIVSSDDDALTFNPRISGLTFIEHCELVLKSAKEGMSWDRLCGATGVCKEQIDRWRCLMADLAPEAKNLLRPHKVTTHSLKVFPYMTPDRQIEAARCMIAINRFDRGVGNALLATSSPRQITRPVPAAWLKQGKRQARAIEDFTKNPTHESEINGFAQNQLDWVCIRAYLRKLLDNARVVRFLAAHHPDQLSELQAVTEFDSD